MNLGFIRKNAWWMAKYALADFEEAVDAGIVAYLQAESDGEIVDGRISKRAARFIRREMMRAAGYYDNLRRPDYGYEDGRRIKYDPNAPPISKSDRYRRKMIRLGLCRICGKKPIPGKTYCVLCIEKRREYMRRYRANGQAAQSIFAHRESDQEML